MTPFCQRPLQVMSLSRYNSANHDLCISLEYLQGEFMLALLKTYTMVGLEARPVDVEVDTVCDPNTPAPAPSITTVGLPDKAVRECGQRVKRAIENAGFRLKYDHITINLAPVELPKHAASFDLPIALGMLAGMGYLEHSRLTQFAVVGELSLAGEARPVRGALSMAIATARRNKLRGLIVPSSNAAEAAVVDGVSIYAVDSLSQAAAFLNGTLEIDCVPSTAQSLFDQHGQYELDYADVRGQDMAKRALIIAAAGAHNLLMVGPPGSGKTMLAKRFPTILPQLANSESIETSQVYSVLGRLAADHPLLVKRPYRAPHHTISQAGLVGGGTTPLPGEISMSHNGVLFLDELPEFSRATLEVLRQPLEDKCVTISRAKGAATFPADFMLLAAMNPCPCGFKNDPRRNCQCQQTVVDRYVSRISGPMLDRIDLQIEVPAVPIEKLSENRNGEPSHDMREKVVVARQAQQQRFQGARNHYNAQMTAPQVRRFCESTQAAQRALRQAVDTMGFSARTHDKILRVARTIADLSGTVKIEEEHVHEAVNYRLLDRQYWSR